MISFEDNGLERFIQALKNIESGLEKDAGTWLEGMGFQFLEEIQREIIRSETVDTRRLLNSFDKGDGQGVWVTSNGGMTLEIGTNVEYAVFANSGHKTVKSSTKGAFKLKDGTLARWVPGYWQGSRFTYDRNAKTGMLLKEKWIEGSHYFDTAVKIWERMFARSIDKLVANFIESKMKEMGL